MVGNSSKLRLVTVPWSGGLNPTGQSIRPPWSRWLGSWNHDQKASVDFLWGSTARGSKVTPEPRALHMSGRLVWPKSILGEHGLDQRGFDESDIQWHKTKIIWYLHFKIEEISWMGLKILIVHWLQDPKFISTLGTAWEVDLGRPSLIWCKSLISVGA